MSNQDLIRKLESSDVEVRREAARALARYPSMGAFMERDERDISEAAGPLAVALFDDDAQVQEHAAPALDPHRPRVAKALAACEARLPGH